MAFPSVPIHGKLARIEKNTTLVDYTSRWSINVVRDAVVFHRQGMNFKDAVEGQMSWTGSGEFYFVRSTDASAVNAIAQSQIQSLVVSTGTALTYSSDVTGPHTDIKFCFDTTANQLLGDINITGMTFDAPVGDLIRCAFTFQGSSALKFSTV